MSAPPSARPRDGGPVGVLNLAIAGLAASLAALGCLAAAAAAGTPLAPPVGGALALVLASGAALASPTRGTPAGGRPRAFAVASIVVLVAAFGGALLVGPGPGPGSTPPPPVLAVAGLLMLAALAIRRDDGPDDGARRAAGLAIVLGAGGGVGDALVRMGEPGAGGAGAGLLLPPLTVMLLALTVLLRDPQRAPARWLLGRSEGARGARLGLGVALTGPMAALLVAWSAHEAGLVSAAAAAAAGTTGATVVAVLVVALLARRLDRASDLRQLADETLRSARGPDAVGALRTDARGIVLDVDEACARLTGRRPAELVGRPWHDVVAPETRREVGERFAQAAGRDRPYRDAVTVDRGGGDVRHVEVALGPVRLARSVEGLAWAGTLTDTTQRRAVELERAAAERHRDAAIDRAPSGVGELSLDGHWIRANRSVCEILGRREEELVGRPVVEVLADDDEARRARDSAAFAARARHGDAGEVGYRTAAGVQRRVRFTTVPVLDDEGAPDYLVVHMFDVTARARAQAELRRSLEEDATTGLHSRQWFERALAAALASTGPDDVAPVLLVLDADRFSDLNDGFGAAAGDALLGALGALVRDEVAGLGRGARLGGDELVVLFESVPLDRARRVAHRLLDAIAAASWPVDVAGLRVTASAGLASLPAEDCRRDDAATELRALADGALRAAKAQGPGRLVVAEPGRVSSGHRDRVAMAGRVRDALAAEAFTVLLQPLARLGDGRVTHAEALVRMADRPGEPPTPPAAFLGVAERYGLLPEIDRLVWRRVVRAMADGRVPEAWTISMNVAAPSLDDEQTPALVERELRAAGVDASRLIFEVTETTAVRDLDTARRFAERMRRLGCRLALDDFGTGYASFASLKQLRYDTVKIDGSYVSGLQHESSDRLLVRALVDLARGLGMRTVAERVEDAETWRQARQLGVDLAQGYLIGRPTAIDEVVPVADAFVPPAAGDRATHLRSLDPGA